MGLVEVARGVLEPRLPESRDCGKSARLELRIDGEANHTALVRSVRDVLLLEDDIHLLHEPLGFPAGGDAARLYRVVGEGNRVEDVSELRGLEERHPRDAIVADRHGAAEAAANKFVQTFEPQLADEDAQARPHARAVRAGSTLPAIDQREAF